MNDRPWKCAVCGFETKLPVRPQDLPVHHNCKPHVPDRGEPWTPWEPASRQRSQEELDYVLSICRECTHYAEETCTLDRGCKQASWSKKILRTNYGCPIGNWGEPVVTICITAFKRPDSLKRLEASIKRYCPALPVLIQDTDGNLSWGRNQLVQKCETKYTAILEDDFELCNSDSIWLMVDVLNKDPEVGVVCGALRTEDRITNYTHNINRFRNTVEFTQPGPGQWRFLPNGEPYLLCDLGFNFIVARTDVLRNLPWDERLELHEHLPWFLKLKEQALWRVAYCPSAICNHHQDRPTEEYENLRSRSKDYWPLLREQYRFDKVHNFEPDVQPAIGEVHPTKPNIIVLAVGHTNTTITTRQIAAMGWNICDPEDPWAELEAIRNINDQLRITDKFDAKQAWEVLASLPQPWVIKDPRFVQHLHAWHQVLARYKPLVVMLTKDPEVVRESYHSRNELGMLPNVNGRMDRCWEQFENWPYAKVHLQVEDIARACALLDPQRMSYALKGE